MTAKTITYTEAYTVIHTGSIPLMVGLFETEEAAQAYADEINEDRANYEYGCYNAEPHKVNYIREGGEVHFVNIGPAFCTFIENLDKFVRDENGILYREDNKAPSWCNPKVKALKNKDKDQ